MSEEETKPPRDFIKEAKESYIKQVENILEKIKEELLGKYFDYDNNHYMAWGSTTWYCDRKEENIIQALLRMIKSGLYCHHFFPTSEAILGIVPKNLPLYSDGEKNYIIVPSTGQLLECQFECLTDIKFEKNKDEDILKKHWFARSSPPGPMEVLYYKKFFGIGENEIITKDEGKIISFETSDYSRKEEEFRRSIDDYFDKKEEEQKERMDEIKKNSRYYKV